MPYCPHHAQTYWNYNSFCGGIFPLLRTEYIYIHTYIHTYIWYIYIYINICKYNICVPSGHLTELWKITMVLTEVGRRGGGARTGSGRWGPHNGTMARLGKCAGLRWKRDTVENLEKIWLKLEKIWRTCGETLVKTSQASPSSRRNHPMKWSQRKRWLRGCPIFWDASWRSDELQCQVLSYFKLTDRACILWVHAVALELIGFYRFYRSSCQMYQDQFVKVLTT